MTAPDGINVPSWVCNDSQRTVVTTEIITVGLDLAKSAFQGMEPMALVERSYEEAAASLVFVA